MKIDLARYRDVAPLARGSCVDVFSAVTDRDGGPVEVCVKRLRAEVSPEREQRFRLAAERAASVRGASIVPFLDYGMTAEGCTFVVERVRGAKLRALVDAHVARRAPVPLEIVVHVGIEVARVLAIGRRAILGGVPTPVAHRGLSPSSIRISDQGAVVVGELGMGTVFPLVEEIRRRVEAGFADYLSPEHLATQTADPRQDLYSLGAVLYELCMGRPPKRGVLAASPNDGASIHLAEARPDLPREFADIVEGLLERDASRRIADPDVVIGSFFKLSVPRVHAQALLGWRDAVIVPEARPIHGSHAFAAVAAHPPVPTPSTFPRSAEGIAHAPQAAPLRRDEKPVLRPTASSLVGLFTAGVVTGFAVAIAIATAIRDF